MAFLGRAILILRQFSRQPMICGKEQRTNETETADCIVRYAGGRPDSRGM
jgi:hypothetical protein